jgi:hypothetical protein
MQQWGAKATLDAWYRVNSRVWVSASANYLQIGKNASLYSKGAYEVWKGERLVVALGGEASAGLGEQRFFDAGRRLNAFGDYYRGGGLVNIRYGSHDVSLSGGMSGNSDESRLWPYVTLNYGRKF